MKPYNQDMRAYRPSIDWFVIKVRQADHSTVAKLAGALGVIEPLKGHDDLVVLRLPDGGCLLYTSPSPRD